MNSAKKALRIGTVERLDGAKMCTLVSIKTSDGSQVFQGGRKGVPD